MAQENEYLQLIQSDLTGEIKRSMQVAVDRDPDTEARLHNLAKRANVPLEAVRLDAKTVERQVQLQEFDYESLAKQYPSTAQLLADPNTAALAKDDVENLSALEDTLNFGANFGRALGTGLIPKANAGLWGAAQAVADVGATVTEPLVGTILPQNPFAVASSQFASFRRGQEEHAKNWRGDQKGAGFIQKSVLSGAESLGMNAALIPASILSASPAPMLAGMTTITGGDAYGQARDKGVPVAGSLAFASSQALIEYATEKLPAVALLKDLGLKKSFGKVLMNQAIAEIPSEQAATVLQDMNEWAVLNPEKPFSDYLAERPSAAAQTLIATLVATGGQVTIGKIADRVANGPREQRAVEILTALKEGTLNSKTFERTPERVKDFIAKHTENGPMENLFIPAEQLAQYFQSVGIDPAAAAAEMGAKNYGEALSTGGDVVVPLADFIANVAKTPHYDALLPDIRFAQGEMTQREADLYEKNHPDEINALIEQARGMQPQGDQAVAQIESDILGQLVASGTERGTAETYAKTYAKAIANLATRSGMDPLALHERYGLTINRPMPEILASIHRTDANIDPLLDRMRSGDMPSDADIFGPSLTEFIRSIGGMRDDGGELRRMEVDAQNAPFVRNLAQATGRAIDEVTALAREAGYPVDDLLDAIDAEVRGNPIYASGNLDEFLLGLRDTVNQLGEYLNSIGIDLGALSNEQVRQVMDEAIGSVYEQEEGEKIQRLFQAIEGYYDTKLRADLPLSAQTYGVRYILRGEIKRARAEAWNNPDDQRDPDKAEERITGAQLVEIITNRLGSDSEAMAYLTALGITEVIDGDPSQEKRQSSKEKGAEVYFQKKDDYVRDMIFTHNLTGKNLLHADKMGGIAVPSLAITKKDTPLDSFGEITLIGSRDMADPKGYAGTKVFGADIYSPRYPSVTYEFPPNMRKRGESMLKDGKDATGTDYIDWSEVESGPRELERIAPFMWQFLKDHGIEPVVVRTATKELPAALQPFVNDKRDAFDLKNSPEFVEAAWQAYTDVLAVAYDGDRAAAEAEVKQDREKTDDRSASYLIRDYANQVERYRRDLRDAGKVDTQATRLSLENQIREADLNESLEAAAAKFFNDIGPNERIFQGYTNSGNRRYIPHTLENVVKILKKELRGGENWNYGTGSVRAKFTPQFKTIKQIQQEKDRLVSKEDFATLKKEIDDELETVSNMLRPHHPASDRMGFGDTVTMMMGDAAKMGIPRALRENGFDEVPADAMQEVGVFLDKLRHLPTEYFEAKILRDVALPEFAGAVIPDNTPADVRAVLERNGIKFAEYKKGDTADRQRAINEFTQQIDEASGGNILFQDPTRLNKDMDRDTMRGYIQFGPERKFNIALLEKADLSTFLHETGHFWLEIMGDLAADPNGAQQIKDDYAATLKFLGVESRGQIGVEQHELFARANEAYLREGKAPSPELRSVFQKFKAWLTMIYKSLDMLNVTLTDEVRGVFDRIYASDAEIEAAKNEMDMPQLFATPADAGMTDEEFAVYSKSVAGTIERAKDNLRTKLMKQFQREKLAWWNEALDKMRADVEKEVDDQPVYKAFDALTKGELPDGTPFKLDKGVLVAQFGKAYVKRMQRGYGDGRGAVFSSDGKGLHHDAAADLLGYGSGAELIEALISMRPRKALIEAEAKQRMVEKYGDLMVDGTIADEATVAMHNEERANLLRTELLAIRKKQIAAAPFVKVEADKAKAQRKQAVAATDTPPVSVFRDAARGMIGQTAVRDIRPYPYLLAERKASKAAFSAMAKGDYQEAAIQKQRELLNHYLYLEATAALETADEIYTYARKFTKGKARAKFGKAGEVYLEQIDDLLEQYEFADVSKSDIVRREKLLQFVRDKMADDEPVMIPDTVLIDAQKRNYKTLPFDQLLAVRDAIRNIEHLVDLKTRLLKVQSQRALEDLVAEGAASIEENGTKREAPIGTRTWLDSAKELRDGYFAAHRKLASLFREMDGWQDDGFMWNTFMKPINDAANEKAVRTEDATKKLAKLYDKLQKPGLANKVKGLGLLSKENYPSLGRSLSRADLLALALNYGNEGNRQRIRDGYGWTDQQVLAALNRLEAHEWEFVQGMWDLIDSYWPEISAQDKRVNGIAPEKVERSGFILPNGRKIDGGYYPIKYDERHSVRSYTDRAKEEADRIMRGAVARPGVDTGFTEARAGKVIDRKIKLDLGVGLQHIDTVLQTLTHREMLIDLNRILGSSKMNGAILEHYGIETYKAIQEAIVDVAAGEIGARDSFEAGMGWLRSGVTVAGMGLNLSTALMQPMGITQSMVRIGPKWAMRGVARFLGDAVHMENSANFVYGKSDMMRLRSKTMNREISEIRNKVSKGGVLPKVEEAYFYAIVKMQAAVDIPTWLGAYEKYMEQTGNDEAKAIALADQAVIDAQGGGQTKDLAGIQRGGPLKKLFTTFYSYFSATWNLTVESAGRTDFKKVGDVGRFAVDMLLLYSVPVVLTAALKEAVKGGEGPDDDEWLAWLAQQHASFALGTLVGFRELGSAFSGMYGYSGPAGTRFFSEASKLAMQAQQGEADEALAKAANNTAGILFHYPAGQLQRTAAGFMALKDGSTSNPMALIFGPRKDE